MGWFDTDFGHEACVVHVFFDGTSGSAASATGPYATISADGTRLDPWVQHTAADVAGWRAECECGWRGAPWTRVQHLVDEDKATRCAFDEHGNADAPDWVVDACMAEWRPHVDALHDDLCPVRDQDGPCLCEFIERVRADQDRRRGR